MEEVMHSMYTNYIKLCSLLVNSSFYKMFLISRHYIGRAGCMDLIMKLYAFT